MQVSGVISVDEIAQVARSQESVELADGVLDTVLETHAAAERISTHSPSYGRSTGVGANKSVDVEDDGEHGMRLIRSHAVDAGPDLADEHVRAMLIVRLNQLCNPGAGLDPAILPALECMLNQGALPRLRAWASIGTGDLGALAGTALALVGERPTARPLEPIPHLDGSSALAFISSNALSIGRAALAVSDVEALARASMNIFGLAAVALHANPQHWSPLAARAAASDGVQEVSASIAQLLAGTGLDAARIQDPYGIRAFPIAHGLLRTRTLELRRAVEALASTAQENPIYDAANDAVAHHAGFYTADLGQRVDALNSSLAQAAQLSISRLRALHEPSNAAEGAFLAAGPGGSSGLMMTEYVAASALAEMRASTRPTGTDTIVLSRGAEEDATFSSQAVLQLERSTAAFRTVLAVELLSATRFLRRTAARIPGASPLSGATAIIASIPHHDGDHDLRPDLDAAHSCVDELGMLPVS